MIDKEFITIDLPKDLTKKVASNFVEQSTIAVDERRGSRHNGERDRGRRKYTTAKFIRALLDPSRE